MQVFNERSERATKAIVESSARQRLIVAGPGTGKTRTFQRALRQAGSRGMALTFIRLLVEDLESELAAEADVMTLHKFCYFWLHRWPATGLSSRFVFYPRLQEILVADLNVLGYPTTKAELDRAMQDAEDESEVDEAASLAVYYDATSYLDVVHRAWKYLAQHAHRTPQYPLIVVDEYQDFTRLETAVIEQLATGSPVLLAGDDDQSLYGRRFASPRFIRELARGGRYATFNLPYCFRCPRVIVEGVTQVITRATAQGLLPGRLEKPFIPSPTKDDDSAAYPNILDVRCSVQNARYPYMSDYIAREIAKIRPEEIEEARAGNFPTVLIIGPRQFLKQIHSQLKANFGFTQIRYATTPDAKIGPLDGYRFLADDEVSNLGWRILAHTSPPENADLVLERALTLQTNLRDELDAEYTKEHLVIARLVGDLIDGHDLTPRQMRTVRRATRLNTAELLEALHLSVDDPDSALEEDAAGSAEQEAPAGLEIVCTSLVGAKGLSAQHVFLVGFVNGLFPVNPTRILDDEVSQLMVALSRTRKQFHALSCRTSLGTPLHASAFADWLTGLTATRTVDAASLKQAAAGGLPYR